eukprot:Amastigsp_a340160_18.p4 type:complete len:103 gc:universal Amastigsp_a340160_18:243-551(+)
MGPRLCCLGATKEARTSPISPSLSLGSSSPTAFSRFASRGRCFRSLLFAATDAGCFPSTSPASNARSCVGATTTTSALDAMFTSTPPSAQTSPTPRRISWCP